MIDINVYNKVIEICFPKLSDNVKEAVYLALNGHNVNVLTKTYGISKNTIYKNIHKYNDKYNLMLEVMELTKMNMPNKHYALFEEVIEQGE